MKLPLTVVAAVSETLPTSVLLGTDVPNLRGLLQENQSIRHYTAGVEAVYVVRTRGQTRQEEAEDAMQLQKEKESEISTKMVDDVAETQLVGSEFDDDLFEESKRNKPYLSRSQKRIEHGLVRA